jgi:predicted membrane protein (TIGR00267 family)
MRSAERFLKAAYLFPLVVGTSDGILSALTLATGRMVDAGQSIGYSLGFRISLAAALSGMFVFFAAEYTRLRLELLHAARQLNLTSHGRLATTRLGHKVWRETLASSVVASACGFLGALFPLLFASLAPSAPWTAILAAIAALGGLGTLLGATVQGSSIRWAVSLMLCGAVLSFAGAQLRVI